MRPIHTYAVHTASDTAYTRRKILKKKRRKKENCKYNDITRATENKAKAKEFCKSAESNNVVPVKLPIH